MRLISRMSIAASVFGLALGAVVLGEPPATMPTTAPDSASTMPTSAPSLIAWDKAIAHEGETATVTGPVLGTHEFGDSGAAVLNIGKNYPDPDRFTAYIPADRRAGVPEDLYAGKTVSVTGEIKIFHGVAEIVAGAKDIVVVKGK